MFGARAAVKKDDDDAGAKPWQWDRVRGAHSARQLRGVLLRALVLALVLVLLGLVAYGVGRGLSSDNDGQTNASGNDAHVAGDNVTRSWMSAQWPQAKSTLAVSNNSAEQQAHSTGSAVGQARSSPRAAATKLKAPKRVWVTEELAEYASLITDEVMQAWALMEADQRHAPSAFTVQQAEFYAALTMLSLNVSTVCELGAADGRSATTWLEALPWTQVYSFSRAQVPDGGGVQQDGSFGPPLTEASDEPGTAIRVPTAASARQALTRQHLKQTYGGRYHWLQLSSISASELQRVAQEQSIDKCDVIAISADQAETSMIATDNGGPSADISTPLPSLKAELVAMRQLTKGWHFLLVDGMGCSDREAAQAAAGVNEPTTSPAAAVGGLLRGPSRSDSSGTRVLPGRRERSAGGCIGGEAARQVPLAAPPQRVRATWEAVVSEGVVVEYECRTGESNPPGWCLGTYRTAQYSNIPGGGSWFKREGMMNAAAGTAGANDDGAPRILSWISSEGMYLNVGDQLRSEREKFYLSMQEDGNLVIYRTHGDGDDSADETGRGGAKAVWSSRTSGSVGNYFLRLQVNMSGCHPS